jgi:hypothetical protein
MGIVWYGVSAKGSTSAMNLASIEEEKKVI